MRNMHREDGGVLLVVAIVMPLLMLLTAGGVAGFSLYASHRELQRAADQAALAGAAALPPADPNVLVENAPFPLPSTDPVYELASGLGVNLPTMRELIPDPRAVSCAIGTNALTAPVADILGAFEDMSDFETPLDDDGAPASTVCDDVRVYPTIQPNPDNTTVLECTNRLVEQVAEQAGLSDLLGGLPIDLPPLVSDVQNLVNGVVKMPLNHVLPAVFTPQMRVTTYGRVRPPLLSLITGDHVGTMKASATAYRRIKNAVVVPILPAQQLSINLGLLRPIDVMTNTVNLNNALRTPQQPLLNAIDDADQRLDGIMDDYGLPCSHLLHNVRQDLRDIYDPPSGPAPSALDIADSAVEAAERTAARVGIPQPNPSDPTSLAGEAFVLIGVAVTNAMQPVSALQIPILDVALVSMREVGEGDYRAAVISAANAHGAFRATLVK
jgi:hypothetical protein